MSATWKERNAAAVASLHPAFQKRVVPFLDACAQVDVPVLVTEGLRAWERQADLYAKGRTKASDICCKHGSTELPVGLCKQHPFGATVTNAQPGYSWHQFAVAIDGVPDDLSHAGLQPDWTPTHPAWQTMLRLAPQFGLAEGAAWRSYPDYPHFQPRELGATPPQLVRDLYKSGGIVGVWAWISREMRA